MDESGPVLPEGVCVHIKDLSGKREEPAERTLGFSDGNERGPAHFVFSSALLQCLIQLNCEWRRSSQYKHLKQLDETIWF